MTAPTLPVTVTPLLGVPEVREGDDIAGAALDLALKLRAARPSGHLPVAGE